MREFYRECAVAVRRAHDAHNAMVWSAWMGEYFARQKKLAKPTALLVGRDAAPAPRPARQTVTQMRAAMEVLSAAYGIPLRKEVIRVQ